MGYAKITWVHEDEEENQYKIRFPHEYREYNAQCITLDRMEVGTVVETVDQNNLCPPAVYKKDTLGIRLLPNTGENVYAPSSKYRWWNVEQLDVDGINARACALLYYFFQHPDNHVWQVEQPLYRLATVTQYIDATHLKVKYFSGQYIPNWPKETELETEYMTCDAKAFLPGDVAVVQFLQRKGKAKVIGFWETPVDCGTRHLLVMLGNEGIGYDWFVYDISRKKYLEDPTYNATRAEIFNRWRPNEDMEEMFLFRGREGVTDTNLPSTSGDCYHPVYTACGGCYAYENYNYKLSGEANTRESYDENDIFWEDGCRTEFGWPTGKVHQTETRYMAAAKIWRQSLMGSMCPYFNYIVNEGADNERDLTGQRAVFRSIYHKVDTTYGQCAYQYLTDEGWWKRDHYVELLTPVGRQKIQWATLLQDLAAPYAKLDYPFWGNNTIGGDEIYTPYTVTHNPYAQSWFIGKYGATAWFQIYAWQIVKRRWKAAFSDVQTDQGKYLVTWYKDLTSSSDYYGYLQPPVPTGELYLCGFQGKSGIVYQIIDGQPTSYLSNTVNGRLCEVDIEPNGRYELRGIPDSFPVRLVFHYTVPEDDYDEDYKAPSPHSYVYYQGPDTGVRTSHEQQFIRQNICIARAAVTVNADNPPSPNAEKRTEELEDAITSLLAQATTRQSSESIIYSDQPIGGRMEVYYAREMISSSLPSSASQFVDRRSVADDFVDILNEHRALLGYHQVRISPELNVAARRHAEDMADNDWFDHQGTDGTWPPERVSDAFFNDATESVDVGECVAYGTDMTTAQDAFDAWYDSPPHYNEMINQDYWEIGLWYKYSDTGSVWYWCLVLGSNIKNKNTKAS